MPDFEPVIGLEVHAQLLTRSKMFCACPASYGDAPNRNVCPVCLGHPGVLPVVNRQAVELAMRLAHAVGATIHERSVFARKNYFYPDLPKGYQISQFDAPLSTGGSITIDVEGETKEIRLVRMHLEEDAGKSKHADSSGGGSLVDFNRVGTPLLEIVSEADMRSPREAHAYLAKLKQIVEYVEVSSGNMEEGNLRCDANVSVRPRGREAFGTKTELKNLNSLRFVERGIAYEIERQIGIIEAGGEVEQATLLWDERTSSTRLMRTKEDAHDYRYFPEPDLPALVVDAAWRERVGASLPELPDAKRTRFVEAYGLRPMDAEVLAQTRELADYYEAVVKVSKDAVAASNWVQSEMLGVLKAEGLTPASFRVVPEQLGELVRLVVTKEISGKIGKSVFAEMVASGKAPGAIIAEKGLSKISDDGAIRGFVEKALAENPDQVAEYLGGKEPIIQYLFGQVMKHSRGRVDPAEGQRVLREVLEAKRSAG